jgi:hypothetical protein
MIPLHPDEIHDYYLMIQSDDCFIVLEINTPRLDGDWVREFYWA